MDLYARIKQLPAMARIGVAAVIKPRKVRRISPQMNIEVTTACNMSCRSCARKYEVERPSHMQFERFVEILDRVMPSMVCFVGFGEPLLHPKIFDLISAVASRGITSSLTTNGVIVGDRVDALLDSGLHTLSVSLDAPSPGLYNEIRNADHFQRITGGIQALIERRRSLQRHTPVLVFHCVVSGLNVDHLSEFIRTVADYQPALVFFQPLEIYREADRPELVRGLSRERLKQALMTAHATAAALKVNTNLSYWLRDADHLWSKYAGSDGRIVSKRACLRPWISTFINVNGDVIPCCGVSTSSKVVMGNIFGMGFEDIWNSERYAAFRRNIKAGRKIYAGCRECVPLTLLDKLRFFSKRKMI